MPGINAKNLPGFVVDAHAPHNDTGYLPDPGTGDTYNAHVPLSDDMEIAPAFVQGSPNIVTAFDLLGQLAADSD